MHVCGIITEYNPFHRGHAYQIAQLRARFGADTAVVCAMSGNFVQRGEPALLRKHARAEAALRSGADLVLELPLPRAVSSAEGFARGGVDVLESTGVVDTLAFGSECADTAALVRAARCLDTQDYALRLRDELSRGVSFPAAREAAVRALLGDGADVLARPNDNLGVEYCRALSHLGSAMQPLALARVGAAHDGGADGTFASASHIRAMLLRGEDASAFLAPAMAGLYAREARAGRAPVSLAAVERAVLARLRTLSPGELAPYCGGNEGLERRLYAAARSACSLDGLLAAAATRRYPVARLRRAVLCAWLDVRTDAFPVRTPYLRVLGFSERGRELLHRMRRCAAADVLTRPADIRCLSPEAQRLFALESRATDLYALAYPALGEAAGGSEWTTGPVIV